MTTDNAQDPAFRGSSWVHEGSLGALRGLTVAITLFGLAIVIFSGPLSSYVLQGTGIFVVGAITVTLILTFVKTSQARLLYIPIPFAVSLAVFLETVTQGDGFSFFSVVISIVLITLLSGSLLLLFSFLRLSRFLTFLPSTAVASIYIAAGMAVMMMVFQNLVATDWDSTISIINLVALILTVMVAPWVDVFRNARWLPAVLIVGLCVLFHASLAIFNISTSEAVEAGSFLQFSTTNFIWPPVSIADFNAFSWDELNLNFIEYLGPAFVFVVLATAGLMRHENSLPEFLDWDRHLRVHGLVNCAAGLLGSAPGSIDTSRHSRADDSAQNTRTEILSAVLVFAVLLVFSAQILPLIPVPIVLGALLILVIQCFQYSDALASDYGSRKVSLTWAIVTLLLIVFATISLGFYGGIFAGLLATIASSVYRASRFHFAKSNYTIADRSSTVLRSIPDQAILKVYGSKTNVYKVQGYAEFGSVRSFVRDVRNTWEARSTPSCLVIEMADVQGFDENALDAFIAFLRFAQKEGVKTILSAAQEGFKFDLRRSRLLTSIDGLIWVDNQEEALIRSEKIILEDYRKQSEVEPGLRDLVLRSVTPELTGYLERQMEFESIVEEISEFGTTTEFEDQGDIVKIGDAQTGVHLVLAGKASLKTPEGVTLREFELGNPIALTNLIEPKSATLSVVAEGSCRTLLIDREAVTRFEEENAQLAMRLYKYLLTAGGEARATN